MTRSRSPACLLAIASVWLLCGVSALAPDAAIAQSSEAELNERTLVNLPMLLEGRYIGDVAVAISADQSEVFVRRDDIERLLAPRLETDVLAKLVATAGGDDLVSADAFASAGLSLEFDLNTLELKVSLPVDLSRVNDVAVSPTEVTSRRADFLESESFAGSVILNYEQSIDYERPGLGLDSPALGADLSLGVGGEGGFFLFSRLQFDGDRQTKFSRGPTLLIHDDVENVVRYSVGDLLPDVRGFQNAPQIGGIGLQRSYDVLQPNRNVRPAGQFRFQLDEPAIVEINVNGAPTRVLRLERGQYDLREFNFITGANEVEIFVIDDFGRRSLAVFDQFFDFNLLAEGLDEFGLFIGARQKQVESGFDYDFNDIAMTGFYRRGISQNVTIGGDFQAEDGRFMVGASTLFAFPIGTIAAVSGFSHDDQSGSGYRLLTSYERSADKFAIFDFPTVSLEAEYLSPDFVTLGDIPVRNEIAFDFRARASAAIGGVFGIGLAATYSVRRDNLDDLYNFSANISTNIGRVSVNLRGEHARFASGWSDNRLLLSAGFRFGQRSTARASYDSRDNRAQVDFARFRNQTLNDYGARFTLVREDDRSSGLAEFSYNQNRALLIARHDTIGDENLRDLRHRTSLNASTQIAFAGDTIALARPVGPRFVIVHPHETLESQVQIRRGISVEQLESTSGDLGPGLGAAGDAYSQRQISVRAPDTPAGYDVGPTLFTLSPPPVAGYKIQLGSEASYSISGLIVGPSGEPVTLLAGRIESLDRENAEPVRFFTNRSGRFVAFGLVPGRHRVTLGSGRLSSVINVTDMGNGTIDLGQVIVEEGVINDQ